MDREKSFKSELLRLREMLELVQKRMAEGGDDGDRLEEFRQNLVKLEKSFVESDQRISDLEIQVNLLTRLLTTICLEQLGLRLSQFRRLIRRMEKEAEEDSEISHLESLFSLEPKNPTHHKLSHFTDKKPRKPPGKPPDPKGRATP